ncbi:AAA family ATPase [Pyrolobus fumarii]|uniref:AAA family ATPase n=1 Tax=Pyrolobus fumarii TaxID=54252 RepID=UPI001FCBA526|nr:AAA family ATPase [Pyrolobus fumarii]
MVKWVSIVKFRGVREGVLSNLAGINILVGRNGSGKTTVLEAVHLALTLTDSFEFLVKRRGWFGLASIDTLFYRCSREARIIVELADRTRQELSLRVERRGETARMVRLEARGRRTGVSDILVYRDGRVVASKLGVAHNSFLVDWNIASSLGASESIYAEMLVHGGFSAKEFLLDMLRSKTGSVRSVEPIRVNNEWILHLVYTDHAIPYYVAGDGIRYALACLMTLVAHRDSVLLLEEPELHLHPGLMKLIAHAIIASYRRRGNQVFVSTHSVELVDMLVREAARNNLGDNEFRIYWLALEDGRLSYTSYGLSNASEALEEMKHWLYN